MFTWRHFVWLAILLVILAIILYLYEKKRPTMRMVLNSACVVCVLSEISKIVSVVEMVPSKNGGQIYPYIPSNHLPLHFCSILIFVIFIANYTENAKLRERLLAFLCPTGILGATAALIMPSIFTTSIPVERAFTSLVSYQFFFYHLMLILLGIIILRSGEIRWRKSHLRMTLAGVWILGASSIYLNSVLASPTYEDGKLKHVDFWTNFFFTYQNPLGIRITEKWQWLLYLCILFVLTIVLIGGFYKLFIFPKIRKEDADIHSL